MLLYTTLISLVPNPAFSKLSSLGEKKKIEIAKERKIGWKGGVVFKKESLSK